MPEPLRVAVVTPYYQEPPDKLRRCLQSVHEQDYPHVTHYCVADGFAQPDTVARFARLRHVVLPNAHGNYGCTPRGIGAQCALADGMDIVCFLDADNYLLPPHVASLVQAHQRACAAGQALDAVFASRTMFVPGHEQLELVPPGEEPGAGFADTSCISLARSAGFLWGAWCQIPRSLTPICDRVMCRLMQHHRLRVAWTGLRTVRYESQWAMSYRQAGLPLPAAGLHDDTLLHVGRDLAPDELWALLRVPWRYGAAAEGAAP